MSTAPVSLAPRRPLFESLNTRWHGPTLGAFIAITLGHWLEHALQAVQIWVLHRPRKEALGALGDIWPALMRSEWLHYGYVFLTLMALALLLPGFTGRARTLWSAALVITVWHLFEHALLLVQAQSHLNLFGQAAPTSLLQLVVPRAELHLVYNALVTIPVFVAMFMHFFAKGEDADAAPCRCAGWLGS